MAILGNLVIIYVRSQGCMIFTIYLHGGICPNPFQAQEIVSFQGNHIRSSCGDVINLNLRLKFAVKIPDMDLLFDFHRKKKPGNSGNSIRFFSHMDKYTNFRAPKDGHSMTCSQG